MEIITYVKSFPLRRFSKDEILVATGEPNDKLFAVQEGFVKVSTSDDVGRQKLLWIAGRYDIVPVEQLFNRKPVHYFYSGMTAGKAYVMEKSKLMAYIKDNPEVMNQIARELSDHHDDLLVRLNAVEQSDIRSKLLLILHNLCTKFSSSDMPRFHEFGLNLTHQDLADMIGSTREAVSLEMTKLRDAKIVDYSRTTFIVNRKAIENHIETPV